MATAPNYTQQQLLQDPNLRNGLSASQMQAAGLTNTQEESALLGYGGTYQYSQDPSTQGAQAWRAANNYTTDQYGNVVYASGTQAGQDPAQLVNMLQAQGLMIDPKTGQIVPLIPGVTSLGTDANGQMPSGVGSIVGNQAPYTPQYQGAADTQLMQTLTAASNPANNVAAQVQPGITSNANAIVGSQYAAPAVAAAGAAGAALTGQGNQSVADAATLSANANSLTPEMQEILTMGFDPQQALYDRTLQQTQEQTRAGLEARGLDMSPVGAGIESDAAKNFNIDWQNNELNRAIQGLTGAEGALGSQGAGFTQANALGSAGAGNIAAGGRLPYDTQTGIYNNNISALTQAANAGNNSMQVPLTAANDLLKYMGQGTSATSVNNKSNTDTLNAMGSIGSAAGGLEQTIASSLSGLAPDVMSALTDLFSGSGSSTDLGTAMPWLEDTAASVGMSLDDFMSSMGIG